jgi:4-amino-4-deoxy-L-arabinose transferase-like glycosyltransferase
MRWSSSILLLFLVFDVWYRAHTFGPDASAALGISLWPSATGATEPLDCDEAAYAYIAHRILHGDVLYRDLTENKPPLGYWLYTLAVALGGYNELTIRIMPIPFVLATIVLVWWIALRLGGSASAALAAALFILLSTDPFLFGNGANLEHFINFFSTAALGFVVLTWDRSDGRYLLASGVCLGAAALVKQIALFHVLLFVPALFLRSWTRVDRQGPRAARGFLDVLAFGSGLLAIVAIVALVLFASGSGRSAYDDIVQYGAALATDTRADPNAPSSFVRWLTGNADPAGRLPWPFGSTDYLVWWGSGSWPLWLASAPSLAWLLLAPGTTAPRRLVAAWTLSAWAQIALPGLYWQHYYLLPTSGVAITVAICLAEAISRLRQRSGSSAVTPRSAVAYWLAAVGGASLAAAIGATVLLQFRDYLGVPPEELTARYKGGRQWVVLRAMGRELARRAAIWDHPSLYVWGWQSPLHFYSRLDSPTRHFFVDNLLRDQADRNHALIQPRLADIMSTLDSRPPELIFAGYAPFRSLLAFLRQGYLASRLGGGGLWVKKPDFGRFEIEGTRGRAPSPGSARGL